MERGMTLAMIGGAVLVFGSAGLWILAGAGVLHAVPRLGALGKWMEERLRRAPMLDLLILYFLVAPGVIGAILGGWVWCIAAILGQIGGGLSWMWIHEQWHRPHGREAKLVRSLNKILGPVRNHAALWVTTAALPAFLLVRLAEVLAYPLLVWLVRLPWYRQGEWVSVSRHKFEGLVGFDRVWCLYCDWMTGVWSLGSEMLRNVESLWCPIRFSDASKCANCRIDFPDVDGGWVAHDGTMDDVVKVVEEKYAGRGRGQPNAWFGHPTRVTVEGQTVVVPARENDGLEARPTGEAEQETEPRPE
jgi:hypothetical protein